VLLCQLCLINLIFIYSIFTATHIFDRTTFIPLPKLHYGSLYDDNFVHLEGATAHKTGYFQFTNRAETMCAVKIVSEGSNVYNEIFRPPYFSGKSCSDVVLFLYI